MKVKLDDDDAAINLAQDTFFAVFKHGKRYCFSLQFTHKPNWANPFR